MCSKSCVKYFVCVTLTLLKHAHVLNNHTIFFNYTKNYVVALKYLTQLNKYKNIYFVCMCGCVGVWVRVCARARARVRVYVCVCV